MRKTFELIAEYEGMPEYAYVGLQIIQNEIDDRIDTDSYIPLDEAITNFNHIPSADVEQHPEHWRQLS